MRSGMMETMKTTIWKQQMKKWNSEPTVQASSWTTTLMEFDKGSYF